MRKSLFPFLLSLFLMVAGLWLATVGTGQDQDLPEPAPIPEGVEVQARGPIHEAFATPTTEPQAAELVTKKPPKPLDELPPDEKPEGDMVWISGYWAWDEDREDYLWVSGIWRSAPPGKRWVPGYWREAGKDHQWVSGFWTVEAKQEAAAVQEVTYFPAPPAPPEVAAPGPAPGADMFFVPGYWVWVDGRYAWRAGYWARIRPDYVWVSAHYRWTPSGYIYIPGYWDIVVARRGVIYAPVVINPVVVGVGFVYTPAYVVSDTILIDTLFVRPCYCHYYFGDYYGVTYTKRGFHSAVVYSRSHYDSIYVYARWENRHVHDWDTVQFNLYIDRDAGRAARPPRTLVQQNTVIKNDVKIVNKTVINNNQVLVPSSQLSKVKNVKTVKIDEDTRKEAKQQAETIQKVAVQRTKEEVAVPAGKLTQPRVAKLDVPETKPTRSKQEAVEAAKKDLSKGLKADDPPKGDKSDKPSIGTLKPDSKPDKPDVKNSLPNVTKPEGGKAPDAGDPSKKSPNDNKNQNEPRIPEVPKNQGQPDVPKTTTPQPTPKPQPKPPQPDPKKSDKDKDKDKNKRPGK